LKKKKTAGGCGEKEASIRREKRKTRSKLRALQVGQFLFPAKIRGRKKGDQRPTGGGKGESKPAT